MKQLQAERLALSRKIAANSVTMWLLTFALALGASKASANGQCPAIGQASSCSTLITITPTGALTFQSDPSVQPFDGVEDVLVGVQNNSGATVFGIQLTGSGIFAFDGDGALGGAYPGPGVSYDIQDSNTAVINFTNGLDTGKFAWFSLEGSPAQAKLTSKVTIDPGHGYDCAKIGQAVGAIGTTDFPASNPPPGKLHEDDLTVAISNRLVPLLNGAGYKVTTTKTDVQSCPDFIKRGEIANNAKSNIFVSVHVNAPRLFGLLGGSVGLYNPTKTSSQTLATVMEAQVSSSLGVRNTGVEARPELAVLKPNVSRMTAVIIETARLGGDDQILHSAGAPALAAAGIKAGLDQFLNQ